MGRECDVFTQIRDKPLPNNGTPHVFIYRRTVKGRLELSRYIVARFVP